MVFQFPRLVGGGGLQLAFRMNGQLVSAPAATDDDTAMLILLYADDMVLMADSAAGLAAALRILEQVATAWCMQLNYTKTECMVFGSNVQQQQPPIQLQHGTIEHSTHFRYLGSIQDESVQQERELSTRLRLAGVAFQQLKKRVFTVQAVSLATKVLIYKAVVIPTLLYGGAESWAPTQAQEHQLDVFNNDCLRCILGVQRGPGMMSNERLHAIAKQPAISAQLREHRLRWLGHVARMSDTSSVKRLLFATAPSMELRHRDRGAPSTTWDRVVLADVRDLGHTLHRDLEQTWLTDCHDRDNWRKLISTAVP